MMSKILRRVVYVFTGLAMFWVFFWWQTHPMLAIVGGLGLLFGFAPVLGFQFLAIWKVNQRDPSPQATPMQHVGAWWAEVMLTFKVFVLQQAYCEHKFADSVSSSKVTSRLTRAVAPVRQGPPASAENSCFTKKQRGVIFIHGFLCNRGFWNPWLQRLQQDGIPFVAISLEPVFTSIDDYALQIEQAVNKLTVQTDLPPLLICHSMGGLAARAWLRTHPGSEMRVSHIVTIGTPHRGTGIVRGPSFAANATQMQKNSAWIHALVADERANNPVGGPPVAQDSAPGTDRTKPYANFTCYYSNCDNIVFPARTATLDGADNRFVPGQAHVQMAFDETVMRESLARL